MKLQIFRSTDNNIVTNKDYSDIKDCGEIAHFLAEIKTIEKELIEVWEEYNEKEE